MSTPKLSAEQLAELRSHAYCICENRGDTLLALLAEHAAQAAEVASLEHTVAQDHARERLLIAQVAAQAARIEELEGECAVLRELARVTLERSPNSWNDAQTAAMGAIRRQEVKAASATEAPTSNTTPTGTRSSTGRHPRHSRRRTARLR